MIVIITITINNNNNNNNDDDDDDDDDNNNNNKCQFTLSINYFSRKLDLSKVCNRNIHPHITG